MVWIHPEELDSVIKVLDNKNIIQITIQKLRNIHVKLV